MRTPRGTARAQRRAITNRVRDIWFCVKEGCGETTIGPDAFCKKHADEVMAKFMEVLFRNEVDNA